jgi:hypothetical protein
MNDDIEIAYNVVEDNNILSPYVKYSQLEQVLMVYPDWDLKTIGNYTIQINLINKFQ